MKNFFNKKNFKGLFQNNLLNIIDHTVLIVILLAILLNGKLGGNDYEEIDYDVLIDLIEDNQISAIEMVSNTNRIKAYGKDSDGNKNEDQSYIVDLISVDVFAEYIQSKITEKADETEEQKISISTTQDTPFDFSKIWPYLLLPIVSIIMMISLRKNLTFDNEIFKNKTAKSKIKFDDVAGLGPEKEELIEVVDFLKNPKKYEQMGAKIPKGVLLEGEPGTGKTLLARAVAGESDVHFTSLAGSEFVEKFVGVGASRIRSAFKMAKKNAPCIIFIDEIDAIGSKRDTDTNSEIDQTLNQLLTELDGFQDRNDIIVFAATNRPETLDPALTRPGRFDRIIPISLPDVHGREEILKIHGKDKPFMEDVDFRQIAYNTAGFSGASLENLLNEAALIAVRKEHKAISNEDLNNALLKISIGLQKSSRIISEKDKILTANHEAGHTIVSLFMASQSSIREVSIIPRGKAGGYTCHDATEDKIVITKTEMSERLITLLAGRAAEQIVLGDISTGASNDIEVATETARQMVAIYGMDSDIGPISINSSGKGSMLSQKTLDSIDDKVSMMLKNAEQKAIDLIVEHRALLDQLVQMLLEQETVKGDEIRRLYEEYTSKK